MVLSGVSLPLPLLTPWPSGQGTKSSLPGAGTLSIVSMYNCHAATFLPHHLDPRSITAPGALSKEWAGGCLIFVPRMLPLGCRKEPNLLPVTSRSLRWGLQVTGISGVCKQKRVGKASLTGGTCSAGGSAAHGP